MGVEWGGRGDKFTRRRLIVLLIVSAIILIGVAIHEGVIHNEPPPSTSPDILTIDEPNGSSDGRYHTCGYVTEHGVTEHLAAYAERCGDLTYASDSKEQHP